MQPITEAYPSGSTARTGLHHTDTLRRCDGSDLGWHSCIFSCIAFQKILLGILVIGMVRRFGSVISCLAGKTHTKIEVHHHRQTWAQGAVREGLLSDQEYAGVSNKGNGIPSTSSKLSSQHEKHMHNALCQHKAAAQPSPGGLAEHSTACFNLTFLFSLCTLQPPPSYRKKSSSYLLPYFIFSSFSNSFRMILTLRLWPNPSLSHCLRAPQILILWERGTSSDTGGTNPSKHRRLQRST